MDTETKSKNTIMIVVIVLLVIVILIVAGYIAIDKGLFNNKNMTNIADKNNNNKEDNQTEINDNVVKPLDITKCLNDTTNSYSNPSADNIQEKYGLSMTINSDKKSVSLAINWAIFGKVATTVAPSAYTDNVETFQITGFSENISSVFVGELGQSAAGLTLFYVMDDGTVEYTPMFIRKVDSKNNYYYAMNYIYEYSTDERIVGKHFETMGAVTGVKNVIKLYNVDATSSSSAGWRTTIGATKEGSFYDLETIINS